MYNIRWISKAKKTNTPTNHKTKTTACHVTAFSRETTGVAGPVGSGAISDGCVCEASCGMVSLQGWSIRAIFTGLWLDPVAR